MQWPEQWRRRTCRRSRAKRQLRQGFWSCDTPRPPTVACSVESECRPPTSVVSFVTQCASTLHAPSTVGSGRAADARDFPPFGPRAGTPFWAVGSHRAVTAARACTTRLGNGVRCRSRYKPGDSAPHLPGSEQSLLEPATHATVADIDADARSAVKECVSRASTSMSVESGVSGERSAGRAVDKGTRYRGQGDPVSVRPARTIRPGPKYAHYWRRTKNFSVRGAVA